MQAAQDRQAKMLEGLLRQRDMYKNMYQQCLKQTPEKKEFSIPEEERKEIDVIKTKDEVSIMQDDVNREKELQRQLEENETKLKQVTDEYDTYKKERAAHERMLGDEVERLRKEAEANSARCCRLKAQLDSANDRFNLLQSNVTSYKSQIKVLEEKCFNYNVTIGNIYYVYYILYYTLKYLLFTNIMLKICMI